MSAPKEQFESLVQNFCQEYADVTPGKMMSSDALKYMGKVFAFFSKSEDMVFKLGKDYPATETEVSILSEFNPFKNKGPLAGWYSVSNINSNLWEHYTLYALETFKNKKR